jgi:uncharacterized integral membrane protein (TIGR00698 family)
MKKLIKTTYGVILCLTIAIIALLLAAYIPIGAVTISIIIGILISNIFKPGAVFKEGVAYSERQVLSFAIALMGVNLNFLILKELGFKSILTIIVAMTATIFLAVFLAGIFKFDKRFALLLGIGNGICGSSAIAATKQIIGANEEEVGLSVAIINFLGTIGIFVLPFIGVVVLKLPQINSGMLIGNTLQAVGQVVAAGFSVGASAGQTATIVKMTRILMLTPVILILIFTVSRKNLKSHREREIRKIKIPLFIIGFILFSLIPTFGLLPLKYIGILSRISHFLLIIAMAGVGLKITFASILRDGKFALMIGSLVFLFQIIFSSSIIYLLF